MEETILHPAAEAEEPNTNGLKILPPTREALVWPAGVAPVEVEPDRGGDHPFKVVGYYPSWSPDAVGRVDFGVLTHVIYAFAIPTVQGTLLPLANPRTARELVDTAHRHGVKATVALGGWSYEDVTLESTFARATDTAEKRQTLVDGLLELCEAFGFDGVDIDWEYPRVDTGTAVQYEELMLLLGRELHTRGKLLTAAVLSGATPEGQVYYDCTAQTNAVLNCVDFINVMAYDGGDGPRHSGLQFALDCAAYWKDLRRLPAHKVVLGIPFYGRPGWPTYCRLLEADPAAHEKDVAMLDGTQVWYNGIPTVREKTAYARANLGGVMVWEVTQDSPLPEKSLLRAIGRTV